MKPEIAAIVIMLIFAFTATLCAGAYWWYLRQKVKILNRMVDENKIRFDEL